MKLETGVGRKDLEEKGDRSIPFPDHLSDCLTDRLTDPLPDLLSKRPAGLTRAVAEVTIRSQKRCDLRQMCPVGFGRLIGSKNER